MLAEIGYGILAVAFLCRPLQRRRGDLRGADKISGHPGSRPEERCCSYGL